MKNILLKFIPACVLMVFSYGCIEEVYSTEYMQSSVAGRSDEAIKALSNAPAAFMYDYNSLGTADAQEFGYPAMMLMRDALTDAPYVTTNYNHFNTPWGSLSDFTSGRAEQPWRYYYRMAYNANMTIKSVPNPDEASASIRRDVGNALVYRALSYMDLVRLYEYKKTGVAALDAQADADGLWGLTTVIVDENFDDANKYNNPRVPFYTMYRFIMSDLDRAERYLADYMRPNKTRADVSVVEAYKARLWLEIATRFEKYPEDLVTMIAHDDDAAILYPKLGVTTVKQCYENAALYARKVIDEHGYQPLTKEQWHDIKTGFNDAGSQDSWIFAVMITSAEAVYSRVNNFLSNCCTEYQRGYSRSQYFCYRMIDKNLYDKIGEGDWRKVTWIDPADAKKPNDPIPDKYYTNFRDNADMKGEWQKRDAYVGFKFRPNEGDTSEDYKKALQVDFPVIRVEEMYFIEAEAKAYTDGMAAGISLMTDFMNGHRYESGTYSISPTDVDDFVDNYLVTQKRVELWGEGLAFFDIKRRELAIKRGYTGSNWISTNRYNSNEGYVASWMNFYIPLAREVQLNKAVKANPNPQVKGSYELWSEN